MYTQEIGRASGALSVALEAVTNDMLSEKASSPSLVEGEDKSKLSECPTPPYYDLYAVHHATSRDIFFATARGSICDVAREAVDALITEIERIEEEIQVYHTRNLPKILVHGDLHYDNVLTSDGEVTGNVDSMGLL